MIKHTNTQRSAFVTQHYFSVTVILLALFLFLPVASWSAGGVIDLPRTGQTTCYDTSGTEISCTGTGQDGDLRAGVASPSPRFVDNVDGTVTDKLTGLMWIKDETTTMKWQAALDYVARLSTGGHTDWRLPNVNELRSLIDYSQKSPALPQGYPFTKDVTSGYWSSTTAASNTYVAWPVDFVSGVSFGYDKTYGFRVRAVRGGQCESLSDSVICLPRTGQTKCYDTSGTEISCAGTGQDGDIQAGVAWPGPRFVDNGDGTVTDKLTGLMWIKDETTTMQWQAALDYVETLGTGGHTDWRLPNIIELRSLVDYARSSPSIPLGNPSPFPNAVPSRYWSSTTLVDDTKAAWYVGFNDGGVGYTNKPDGSCVRPVRTVQFEPVTTTTTTTASPVSTTTTTTTPAGPCPAKTALGGQAPELQLLRLLRDRLMQRSAQGIVYVALYYRNALEISSLLEADPKLKEEARSLIMRLLPMIQKLLAQKAAMIDACNVTQAAALLDNLSALGSPSLKADLLILKTEMQSGRLFKELNISIAGRER